MPVARSSLLTHARELAAMIPRPRQADARDHPTAAHRRTRAAAPAPGSERSVRERLALARERWRARRPRPRAQQPNKPLWRRRPEEEDEGHRWRSRPFVAGCLKALVVLIPAASAILATALLNWGMEAPESLLLRVGWWLILLAVSTVNATAVQTQTRRLLPLAVLFKLTLLFPDEVPSRYRVARAAASPQKLRDLSRGSSPLAQVAT